MLWLCVVAGVLSIRHHSVLQFQATTIAHIVVVVGKCACLECVRLAIVIVIIITIIISVFVVGSVALSSELTPKIIVNFIIVAIVIINAVGLGPTACIYISIGIVIVINIGGTAVKLPTRFWHR